MAEDRFFDNIRIAWQSRAAHFDRCVYLSVDRGFYPFALFVAHQIATKTPDRDFDICILSQDELPPHPLWDAQSIRVLRIDTADLADKVPSDARVSFAAYLRIMAPALLQDDYRRLLYLDADVFYNRGDLSRLLDLDLNGRPIGAVRDMNQLREKARIPDDFKPFGLGFAPYFNSGIMLIDNAAWTAQDVSESCIKFAIENADKILQHDQTVLNITLRNNWVELPMVWNFLYSHQTLYFSAMFDVCFYHFIGRRKPFKGKYGGFPRRFTREYQSFFDTHFPDHEFEIEDGLQIETYWHKHVLALLFHLVNVRRFLWNDDRFESDWEVKDPS